MTQINLSQIDSKLKILNVVQTGTLTRDGAVFSGFSSNGYLRLGARVDKGILSLDSSTYVKDFTGFYNANTIEINGSFVCTAQQTGGLAAQYPMAGTSNKNGIYVELKNKDDIVTFAVAIGDGTNYVYSTEQDISFNTKYYFRISCSIENNILTFTTYLNTDGQTYDNTTKISTDTITSPVISGITIGTLNWTSNYDLRGSVDIADWSIKKNGEFWWKGVETI